MRSKVELDAELLMSDTSEMLQEDILSGVDMSLLTTELWLVTWLDIVHQRRQIQTGLLRKQAFLMKNT